MRQLEGRKKQHQDLWNLSHSKTHVQGEQDNNELAEIAKIYTHLYAASRVSSTHQAVKVPPALQRKRMMIYFSVNYLSLFAFVWPYFSLTISTDLRQLQSAHRLPLTFCSNDSANQ